MSTGEGDGLLSRWERRKQAVQDEAAAETVAVEEAQLAQDQARLEEKTDEEILEELGLPDPGTLKEGDDFKAFMQAAVPARLRNRALRKLWLSNPALANLDMLVDYGEDFTDSATVVAGMQTVYEVGKGMLRKVEEVAEKLELDEQEGGSFQDDLDAQSAKDTEAPEREATAQIGDPEEATPVAEPAMNETVDIEIGEAETDLQAQLPPRRMSFSFSED